MAGWSARRVSCLAEALGFVAYVAWYIWRGQAMMPATWWVFAAWLVLLNSARAVEQEQKAYPFFPFCIDWHDAKKRSFQQQAEMLKSLGYDGVGHIWLDKVDRPNVGVMFNLCHWLRVDKQRDYKPLLKRAMPRLWAVSINGADQFDAKPGWSHYIQPLDRGSFDVGGLLKTLKELGYRGPIGLQCFGIGGDAREHLARSMAAWQKLSANLRD